MLALTWSAKNNRTRLQDKKSKTVKEKGKKI